MKVSGEFEIVLKPLEKYVQDNAFVKFGRMSINKTFKGDLTGASKGEMLTAMTATEESAGYVAIELAKVTLAGKNGSFVLQHFGVNDRGEHRLILEVVPESGSGDLKGISGQMAIDIKDGKHFYTFEYKLPV